MDTTIAPTTRLFPRGTTPLALATAFATLSHFLALGCLYSFVDDVLGLSSDEATIAWNAYAMATIILYVVGGLWGDFGGHRRNLIIGPSITIAALFLLLITPDSGDAGAGAGLLVFFSLSAFALGHALFVVACGALAAHLYDGDGCRVPLVGAYTLLHVAGNAGVMLLAPFAVVELLGDQLGLSRDESQRALFALAAQPAIGALIVGVVAKRTFAAAELGARAKAAAKDASPLDDGAVAYRRSAIGLLVAAAALGFWAYHAATDGAYDLASRLDTVDGDWSSVLQPLSAAIVVFLAPIAVIVYGRMRRGDGRVATAGVAVVGAALIGVGLTILLAASAMMPDAPSEFAPPWLEDTPSVAWPIAALVLVSLGEILFIPLVSTLFMGLAPRRLRGLFIGFALASAGVIVFFTRLVDDAVDGIPLTASAALALAAAIACAALLAVVGTVFRSKSAA